MKNQKPYQYKRSKTGKGGVEFMSVEQETWDIDYTSAADEFMPMAFAASSIVTATPYYGDDEYTRVTMTDGKAYIVYCAYQTIKALMDGGHYHGEIY